jgi:hypothetical protein
VDQNTKAAAALGQFRLLKLLNILSSYLHHRTKEESFLTYGSFIIEKFMRELGNARREIIKNVSKGSKKF